MSRATLLLYTCVGRLPKLTPSRSISFAEVESPTFLSRSAFVVALAPLPAPTPCFPAFPHGLFMFRIPLSIVVCFAMGAIAFGQEPTPLSPRDKLIVETVLRIKDFKIESSAPAKAALLRYLRSQPGTEQYFELIERFGLTDVAEELTEFAIAHADETAGVRAAELLFKLDSQKLLIDAISADANDHAVAAVSLIGRVAGTKTQEILMPLVAASDKSAELRAAAVAAIARRSDGQRALLKFVADGKLPADLNFAAANALFGSDDKSIVAEAAKYLQLPATADSQPLPPISELIQKRGDPVAGAIVFRKSGTCINCHKVKGEGKEVGPDLSQIGSKLSREAMYVAVLNPSAAVSHNFETYSLLTIDGDATTGLLVSETDAAVTLRNAEGIDKTVARDDIELFQKQAKSLMPQDLQRLMTVPQLIDLIEYTLTLTK